MADDSTLMGDLALESVQILELLVKIEKEFDIQLDPATTEPLLRFGELVDAIVAKIDSCEGNPVTSTP